tara:strand:+ start:541 stop:711 length:171 start_codon:yes stop_codon:yes gene_type:complete
MTPKFKTPKWFITSNNRMLNGIIETLTSINAFNLDQEFVVSTRGRRQKALEAYDTH